MIDLREGAPSYWNVQATTPEAAAAAVCDPGHADRHVDFLYEQAPYYDPRRILEVGCGIGRLAIPMARRWPGATVVGVDFSDGLLAYAHSEAKRTGTTNLRLIRGEASFDVMGCDYDYAYSVAVFQHNQDDVCAAIVTEVADSLVPGGRFVFQVADDRPWSSWLDDAGLEPVRTRGDDVFPTWTWIVADKP